jgi:hypothetical protein
MLLSWLFFFKPCDVLFQPSNARCHIFHQNIKKKNIILNSEIGHSIQAPQSHSLLYKWACLLACHSMSVA